MVKITPDELLALLQGCARNDRKSQEKLYRLFYSFAASICVRYCPNRDAAVEVVNDAFLKIFNGMNHYQIEKYDPVPSFIGYFKKIIVRTAIDQYRSTFKHTQQVDLEENIPDTNRYEAPLDGLAYEELIRCVQRLTPGYRAVFNLHVIDGFSHEEVAEQLGISVGTSKSNLAKARQHLKEYLKQSHAERSSKYV